MSRKFFKRISGDTDNLNKSNAFKKFKHLLKHPYLFHFNRHSISKAIAIGLFLTFMPIPMQMLVALWASVLVRANLPLALITVWISNPVTIPFIFLAAYQTGSIVLGTPAEISEFQWEADFFATTFLQLWQPIVIGCFLLGALSSLVGYCLVQLLWRLHIVRYWKERKQRKSQRTKVADTNNLSD